MSIGWQDYLQFLLALLFVLGLIALLAVALKKLGPQRYMPRTDRRRLSVVEVLPVDARRRLVLLRRDDRDHLVLIGPNEDVVIESGIAVVARPEDDQPGTGQPSPRESFQALLARVTALRGKSQAPEEPGPVDN